MTGHLQTAIIIMLLLILPVHVKAIETFLMPVKLPSPEGSVDVIVEADSYVPTFYRGRGEPASGSTIRLIAIPDIGSASDLRFQWTVGNMSTSTRSSFITIDVPQIATVLRVNLKVLDQNNKLLAESNNQINLKSPELIFYEDNLLQGMSNIAITDKFTLVGREASIAAEPYFISRQLKEQLTSIWKLNGKAISSGNDDWNRLLIERKSPENEGTVSIEVNNRGQLFTPLEASFWLEYGI